jgi:hypothetical protein
MSSPSEQELGIQKPLTAKIAKEGREGRKEGERAIFK